MKKIEIACFDVSSAILAAEGGADRIELCSNYSIGGVTPPLEWIEKVKASTNVPIRVMIRPREGDFCYSWEEFEVMKSTINACKEIGIEGVVFGILNSEGMLDIERNTFLRNLAFPLACTFHRAFDVLLDKQEALESLIKIGFDTVLTSGVISSAREGVDVLRELVIQADNRIIVMPGGGVRSSNIIFIDKNVGASFYHTAAWSKERNGLEVEEVLLIKQKV